MRPALSKGSNKILELNKFKLLIPDFSKRLAQSIVNKPKNAFKHKIGEKVQFSFEFQGFKGEV